MPYDEEEILQMGAKGAHVVSFVVLTQIGSILINGLALIFLARLLGPSDYGIYTLALGVQAIFSVFSGANLGDYLNRSIPKMMAKKDSEGLSEMLGDVFFVLLLISVASALVGVALSGVIAGYVFHDINYAILIDLTLLGVITTMFMYIEYYALIGFGDGKGSALTAFANSFFFIATSVTLVYMHYGAYGAIAGIIIGPLASALVGIVFIRRHSAVRINFKGMLARAKKTLSFSLRLTASAIISGLVSNFSILLLGIFAASTAVVGAFGVANKIGSIISIILVSISIALVRLFSSASEHKERISILGRLYDNSVYFGLLVTAPIAVYLIDFPQAFITSVFPAYQAAVLYVPALGVSILLGIFGLYASSIVISAGETGRVLKYGIILSVAQLIAILILVPAVGVYGIIIGIYLLGSIITDILYVNHIRKVLHMKIQTGRILKTVIANILLGLLLFPINLLGISATYKLALGILAIAIVYPILLVRSGAFSKNEFELLDKLSKRMEIIGKLIGLATRYAAIFR